VVLAELAAAWATHRRSAPDRA